MILPSIFSFSFSSYLNIQDDPIIEGDLYLCIEDGIMKLDFNCIKVVENKHKGEVKERGITLVECNKELYEKPISRKQSKIVLILLF